MPKKTSTVGSADADLAGPSLVADAQADGPAETAGSPDGLDQASLAPVAVDLVADVFDLVVDKPVAQVGDRQMYRGDRVGRLTLVAGVTAEAFVRAVQRGRLVGDGVKLAAAVRLVAAVPSPILRGPDVPAGAPIGVVEPGLGVTLPYLMDGLRFGVVRCVPVAEDDR